MHTITEAAKILGISHTATWFHVRLGHLPAQRIGAVWIIEDKDLETFKEQREK